MESALLELEDITQAIAVGRDEGQGQNALVAYLVDSGTRPTVSAMRATLREKLPEYMVPTRFVFLESMPRTATGKISRKELPEPPPGRPDLDSPYEAARTPVEEELAAIWSIVLGVSPVGIHDNFLDLGGHSLLATRVISRTIEKFQVDVPLATLLAAGTVAQMSLVITEKLAAASAALDMAGLLGEIEGETGLNP